MTCWSLAQVDKAAVEASLITGWFSARYSAFSKRLPSLESELRKLTPATQEQIEAEAKALFARMNVYFAGQRHG